MTERNDGFTLLEMAVVLAVLGLLSLLLLQGTRFGLRTVEAQAAYRDRQGGFEPVDRTLRGLFERADPGVYPEPATLRGTARAVSLTTSLPLGAGPLQPADVALDVEGGRLLLCWTLHRHVQAFAPPPGRTEVLLTGVDGIEIRYWRGDGWSQAWSGDKLPALVELRIQLDPHSGRHWPPMIMATRREPVEE